MKRCPSCQQTYDDAQSFCSVDAAPLVGEASSYDQQKTALASTGAPPPINAPQGQYVVGAPLGHQQSNQQQQQLPPAHGHKKSNTNTILLAGIGLLLVVGIGLGVYFLKRSTSSPSSTSSPASSPSAVAASTPVPAPTPSPSSTPTPTPSLSLDYEKILPRQVGRFTRLELNTKSYVIKYFEEVGSNLPTPTGSGIGFYNSPDNSSSDAGKAEIRFEAIQFESEAVADTALKDYFLVKDTFIYPDVAPSEDIQRFKIVKRTPLASGKEMVILKTLPNYPHEDKMYWVAGRQLFRVTGYKPEIIEEFASQYGPR
jgi:hypothetical protein